MKLEKWCVCVCISFGEFKLKDEDGLCERLILWRMICLEDDLCGG